MVQHTSGPRSRRAPSSSPRSGPKSAPPRDSFGGDGLPLRFGRYLLLRLLARGGMGQIYLASTTGVEGAERPVVVKVIRREHAKDQNFLARFLDEARVQSQLSHSGVAQVVEAATHAPTGDPYVVMEYIEGRSLGNVRRRVSEVGMRVGWEDAVALSTLISEALTHIHERRDAGGSPLGIVHRDLSPHNVMLTYGGEVKVIDFGTARGHNRRCHTVAGVVFAKPGYVAPEVANGDSGDFRVDMYAAGVMLWELCAGRRFLQGDAQPHMAKVAKGQMPLPPIAKAIGAPAKLDDVIARMTAFDREDRYDSSRQAATELAKLLAHAEPLPNGERGVRARAAQLMYSLYPAQPGRCRREFARLVDAARREAPTEWETPPEAEAEADAEEQDDMLSGTRYRLVREIGAGASSVVFEGEHVDLGRRVAIKVLDAEHTHSTDFVGRFRREARALSRLHHPGLVRVHDFGQSDSGRMFYVMELLEGSTLARTMEQHGGPLGWKSALRIARQALLALHVAHKRDVVHRDITPANLFLTEAGKVKLIDFGLSKTGEDGEPKRGSKPDLGAMTLFGTPGYMAPEQIAGGVVDGRADIYAIGCLLYQMLTGSLPFVGESDVAVLDAKLKGSPESPRERTPARQIPRSVSRLVMRALARHPTRRFETAGAMAEAIARALDEPTRRRARRRAIGSTVVAGVMAFGVVLLGYQAQPLLDTLPGKLPWLKAPVQTQQDDDPAPAKRERRQRIETESDASPRPAALPKHVRKVRQINLPTVEIADRGDH